MSTYPIFLDLSGRKAVIIGAGTVAVRKAQQLIDTGAQIVITAKKVSDEMASLCNRNTNTELIISDYNKDILDGAVIAIAATSDSKLNKQIYKDCQQLGVLCNVCDGPQYCDFFVPAVLKQGDLQIAISTNGTCPAYASHIRKKLEHTFTQDHSRFLTQLKTLRKQLQKDTPNQNTRKAILARLADDESFEYFLHHDTAQWQQRAKKIIAEYI